MRKLLCRVKYRKFEVAWHLEMVTAREESRNGVGETVELSNMVGS